MIQKWLSITIFKMNMLWQWSQATNELFHVNIENIAIQYITRLFDLSEYILYDDHISNYNKWNYLTLTHKT